ncbi:MULTISPECIES: glucosyl-3-phosphoglycerate synthase [Arsenicicoccus]|uniref:glucosyl-3-phosphoglycerate synthase n=2 Tax=Arsenicicoccus TaxID=267408 RepID=UPI00257945B3|nr:MULTISPECIES: glucosyl-3-phosphoglycerate synthase [Arsenicicoccus]
MGEALVQDVIATVESLMGSRPLARLPAAGPAQALGRGMNPVHQGWFARNTSSTQDWPLARLLSLKESTTIAVVIPARDEQQTVGQVVGEIANDLSGLVDELLVLDSLSSDRTASVARAAGATVWSVEDIRPDLGVRAGKGEALWKSQFVTSSEIVVFIDADLTGWGTHFVSALLGPLLSDPDSLLVKGFYDRILDMGDGISSEGGRVTELVARPWLALNRPSLSCVVQPLAGEWATRRSHLASLSIPYGYGVELATLLDTESRHGVNAIAQVDLGHRAHSHQNLHDLGAMATEILAVADRRRRLQQPDEIVLPRLGRDRTWTERRVVTAERPPFETLEAGPRVEKARR